MTSPRKRALAVLFCLVLPLAAASAGLAQAVITNTATVTATNGYTANGDGSMTITNQLAAPVPALSPAGMAALVLTLAGFALVMLRRQAKQNS